MDVYEQRGTHAVEAEGAVPGAPAVVPASPAEADLVGRPVPPGAAVPVAPMTPVAPVPAPVPAVAAAPVAPVTGGRYVRTTYVSSGPAAYRARQIVWLAYGVVATFLVLDLLFHAAGANSASAFVTFVFNVGGAFNSPFRNIFAGERPGVATVEWADVIALGLYAVAAWMVERVIIIMRARPDRPV